MKLLASAEVCGDLIEDWCFRIFCPAKNADLMYAVEMIQIKPRKDC